MNRYIKILINYFLGPLLFIILSWSLYRQIVNQPDLPNRWHEIKDSWLNWKFWLVIFLMFVNWGIEAKKWQLLIHHLQRFSFIKAYKAVLSGCSVTMLTPNRVGEYGGRILYVENENRIKAISLTIVGSISQLLITLIMGCLGLLFLRFFSQNNSNALNVLPDFWSNVLIYLSVGVTVFLLLFYLRLGWLVRMMEKVPALQKVVRHISVLDEFSDKQLFTILLLSFVRFLVFVLQYVLLLQVMHVGIGGWLCFWLMTVFYLVMAVAPTLGFVELPVRAKASWEILKFYTGNELGVGAAALGIWLINLVVPAIIGSLLILSIKILKEKDEKLN
ncbi:flippase-like domain-containing protein [Ferruginibacter lapsinanis]|uniref:lysylphosphatidylglycerol synthase transmembrane domain-containing protein n=1 Tax=Ferruginibacter lapsinanis TaxID=563172 RepID=UPI001E4B5172|nr:lysylphosphatidylglycerol synthase transmembrane domain-containing protein [Ferruginibacter lapsinanis]UEG50423.1 flippase-like domain-containing protein [Ferruginibacter lapsinanis]